MNNCALSYESSDLESADAVLFHLHRLDGVKNLPQRTNWKQRWIFLTDESPYNTFLKQPRQSLTDYNGIFNWSMNYRMDSDVPVPYGRTVFLSNADFSNFNNADFNEVVEPIFGKTKLAAVLGSNCASKNQRWQYVKELKKLLGNNNINNNDRHRIILIGFYTFFFLVSSDAPGYYFSR